MTYQPATYRTNGGDKHVIASGGELDVESGGALKIAGTQVTASAAELNKSVAAPAGITFAADPAGADVCEVTCTVRDADGDTLEGVFNFDLWLSDAETGAGLTDTTASGTVTAKEASGAVIGTLTDKKALRVQTLATGVFILEITDSSKTAFYPAAQIPSTGATTVGDQLETADYGA